MKLAQIPVLKPCYVPCIPGPKGRDIQMTGALKCSFPPVCWNVCLPERPPVCALWANYSYSLFQVLKNFAYVSCMSWLVCGLDILRFFTLRTADRQTDIQTDMHAHTYTFSCVGAFLQEYIQANDPELHALPLSHAPQYTCICVFVFWNKTVAFLQAVWTQIILLMYNVGAFWYWSTLFVPILKYQLWDLFESHFVWNPEDRFCRIEAQLLLAKYHSMSSQLSNVANYIAFDLLSPSSIFYVYEKTGLWESYTYT